jgi:hypothetical protein
MNRNLTVRRSFVSGPAGALVGVALVLAPTSVACGGGSSGGGGGGGVVAARAVTAGATPARSTSVSASAPAESAATSLAASTPASPASTSAPAPSAGLRMGMNLSFVSYYMPDWAFVDVFKASQVKDGFPWDLVGGGAPPALDAQGYPRGLAAGQAVSTIMVRATGGHYPGGVYTLLFDGDGDVQLGFDAEPVRVSNNGAGTANRVFTVTPTGEGIQVRIVRSNPANHVRNIRVYMPGFANGATTFHPTFLDRLRPFSVLRFMDWPRTNRNPVVRWADRTSPSYRSQAGSKGVAWEYAIELCNLLGKDAWLSVPHAADDDYVRSLAALVRDKLASNLKVYVEYSNEVWNGAFTQRKFVESAGAAAGRDWIQQYVARSVELFRIFEATLGGRSRLVRVIAGQSDNSGVCKQAIDALPAGAADALAIAPYFGGHLGNAKHAAATSAMSVDQVLNACATDLANRRSHVVTHANLAKAAGLELVAYEGGQHLAGVGEAANDERLTAVMIAANRHPRMKQLYGEYLAMWKAEGGGLFCAYSYCYVPQKWGSWGALEYQDQVGAPKYDALVEAASAWGAR